jgi:uncharacterized protein YndB with AHSA1/START domain
MTTSAAKPQVKPTSSPQSETDVVVRVRIAAAPATVWTFLSDGERFRAWIGAYAGQAPLAGTRIDPRPGGAVRVEYPGGQFGVGKVTEMIPQQRIAFSWGYEKPGEAVAPGATTVEITLQPTPDGTLVELRHRGLPSEDARRGHCGGWTHYLSMLARAAAEGQHGPLLARLWEDYYQAWSEHDATARLRLLEVCCEPDVRVRTSFACTDSLPDFSAHIANGLKHMPGMSIRPRGNPQHLHGCTRHEWELVAPGGAVVMAGVNFATLSPGGRIAQLVSFSNV